MISRSSAGCCSNGCSSAGCSNGGSWLPICISFLSTWLSKTVTCATKSIPMRTYMNITVYQELSKLNVNTYILHRNHEKREGEHNITFAARRCAPDKLQKRLLLLFVQLYIHMNVIKGRQSECQVQIKQEGRYVMWRHHVCRHWTEWCNAWIDHGLSTAGAHRLPAVHAHQAVAVSRDAGDRGCCLLSWTSSTIPLHARAPPRTSSVACFPRKRVLRKNCADHPLC